MLSLSWIFAKNGRDSHVSTKSAAPPGLSNLGNSCYINSVVQALACSYSFVSYIEDHQQRLSTNEIGGELVKCILGGTFFFIQVCFWTKPQIFFSAMVDVGSASGSLRPSELVNAIRRRFKDLGYDQNDAHELLLLLLDVLFDRRNSSLPNRGALRKTVMRNLDICRDFGHPRFYQHGNQTLQFTSNFELSQQCSYAITPFMRNGPD